VSTLVHTAFLQFYVFVGLLDFHICLLLAVPQTRHLCSFLYL